MKCSAKNRAGKPCGNWAIKGGTVCRSHGGAAPRVKAAAARRRAQAEAAKALALFGAPKDVEPSQALLDLVHWTAGEVEYWREQRAFVVSASMGSHPLNDVHGGGGDF